jgi:hypothetical protein
MVSYRGNFFRRGNSGFPWRFPNWRGVLMLVSVAKCSRCRAVINAHWKACLVCQSPIDAVPIQTLSDAVDISITPTAKAEEPCPPLLPGWLVAYRHRDGRLRGGCDEREAGTVTACHWDGTGWTVSLSNGDRFPLQRITAVSKTDAQGRVLAAWAVREHGFNGEGPVTRGGQN